MPVTELVSMTLARAGALIHAPARSPSALTLASLARIARRDTTINAAITVIAAGNNYRGPLPVPLFVLLLVIGILLLVFVPLGIVFATIRRRYVPDARMLKASELAEATITRRWQTGVRVNNRFGIGLDLEVRRSGYPAYPAQARVLVSFFDAARFSVGAVLPVRVDPSRPERVYIETRSEL